MTNLLFAPPALGTALSLTGLPGGGNKIHDRSPFGNHGAITGATWVRLPSGLWCLYFDGTDDGVNCGNKTSFNITDAITLGAWVKPATTTPASDEYIVCKGNDRYMMQHQTTGKFRFYLGGIGIDVSSITTGAADTWYFIAATYCKDAGDGKEAKIYVNGNLKNTDTSTQSITTDVDNLYIGRWSGAGHLFNGCIALACVYNHALSALDIQNTFNQEKHLFGVW